MIHLLFSSFEAVLQGCADKTVDEIFSSKEQGELSRLKLPARRLEWQASRTGAKLLVRSSCPEYAGLPLDSIQLIREPNGVPRLSVEGVEGNPGCFSQSHSNGFLLSGYNSDGERLGVDLEKIENRSNTFVNDYFTDGEIRYIQELANGDQVLATTMIWSAKEAVLKTALLGLKIDTRRVEIIPGGNLSLESTWQPAHVNDSELGLENPWLYWRKQAGFILTLCVDSKNPLAIQWVKI